MAYIELRKLYYGDKSEYAQAYLTRFNSKDAIKINFNIADKQAFFLQCSEVMQLAYKIAKLDKEVLMLSQELPGVAHTQYYKKCIIDEIVLTNKIEGVHSSRKEIGDVLSVLAQQSNEKGNHHRFIGLVNKYLMLMTKEELSLKTCQDVRSLYDEICLEEVILENPNNAPDGIIFRKEKTSIHSITDKVIHTGIMPEKNIIDAMNKALFFFNDKSVEKLFRICLFHYLIEYIHPFYDGNGRLGRFILSYCISETLEPLVALRISEVIKENISKYYKAFEICNDPRNLGDLTPFLIMLLNMIYMAMKDLRDSLTRRLLSWKEYEELLFNLPDIPCDKNMRKMYSYLIQATLFSEDGISTSELKAEFDGSYHIVKKLLDTIPGSLLISHRKGRAKYYQINLSFLDEKLLKNKL